jgi:outer membrane protein OmpA-like peptidoglycan-associated protein
MWLHFCILYAAILVAGCSPTKSVVVLLPDSEGRVGDLRIHSSRGDIQLNKAYHSVTFDPQSGSGLSGASMEDEAITDIFGGALAAEPKIPSRIDVFTLYYKMDSVALTPDSSRRMDAVISFLKEADVLEIYVIGHADRLGTRSYNRDLSRQRAVFMKNRLVADGILPERIFVSFLGETDPQIETADEVEEPLNRRVRIVVKHKSKEFHDHPDAP